MKIEILGTGCPKCKKLMEITQEAVSEMGIGTTASISKIDQIKDIVNFGVMTTPALALDGKVVVSGRVPSKDEIKKLIQNQDSNGDCACGHGCCCK